MLGLQFVNDLSEPRRDARNIIAHHLHGKGEFSFSYIAQLLSSTVVCTLGLITNSVAVVIGGMIIAPLMWPILNVSYKLVTKKTKISINPFIILVISTIAIFAGATLVALLTPYKEITSEMLLRTSPTSLEIFIALAAAVIAALAVAIPKISDSVAGVAVATSLVPPLCVSGIGLAYFNFEVLYGGFLLFLTNALTIMLVSTLIFSVFINGRDFSKLETKQVALIIGALVIISFPLYWQLESSIASSAISNSAKTTIDKKVEEFVPNTEIQNYQIKLSPDGNKVSIKALLLLPPTRTISFEQEKEIIDELTNKLGKQIDLQLVQQDSIQPVTEKELQEIGERKIVEESFNEQIAELDSTIRINSVNAQLDSQAGWNIGASIRSTSELDINTEDITAIEEKIGKLVGRDVTISMEVLDSKIIGANQEREDLLASIRKSLRGINGVNSVVSLELEENSDKKATATALLLVNDSIEFNNQDKQRLEKQLSSTSKKAITLNISLVATKPY